TLAEAALLAGLPKAPSEYSPFNNPKRARERQIYALNQMLKNGFITREQVEAALNEELRFIRRPNVNTTLTPYFTEHVRRLLAEKYGEERLYNDGFRVYTPVNIEYEVEARKAVDQGLREFTKRREYRGPLKQLKPEEAPAFLAEQEAALGRGPLPQHRDLMAVVSEVDAKTRALTVQVGPHAGLVPAEEIRWAQSGKTPAKTLAPGDVILVRFLGQDEKTGRLRFSLEQEPMVHAALLSVENATGAVKAMIGGRDFNESQFNRAIQAKRQPGSSFKPIIYTAAMDHGFTPGSTLIDAPMVYDDFAHGRRWKPTNFDHKFYGCTDLYTGLTSSRNIMAIKLLDKVGYEAVFETARKLGITSELPQNLTLALGSHGVTLLEMVQAFTTFPNLGERVVPQYMTRILDRDGNLVEELKPVRIRAISSGTACVIQHMLLGVVAHGTGTRVRALGRPVGGKTGTTNDLADAWFIGFTPEYTTGVWVGRDKMERMGWGESGGRAAAPIFLYYMQSILKDKPIRHFEVPEDAVIVNNGSVDICYKKGTEGTGYSECGQSEGKEEFLKSDLSGSEDKEM
ncbi:MAG: penicillin-binding transpeptidase domain-containing protein, partial [Thermodesulfobacteriota bacterium]